MKKNLNEDGAAVAVNNAGGGAIAGIGIGPNGEPGVRRRKKKLRDIIRHVSTKK